MLLIAFAIVGLVRQPVSRGGAIDNLCDLAGLAISENAATAKTAIVQLRSHGPEGLRALLSVHAELVARHQGRPAALVATGSGEVADPNWQRLQTALDQVSGQRDCHASRLFWYTDFEEAKAAAQREHKPILSLRLLGKLTDEYSCANSRFFRTTLYANDAVGKELRDRFILHWKSVRPVPKVTIDFGDGRKLERTLTGNSIHYVLDSDGRVIDALPGLYGPAAFLRELDRAEKIARRSANLAPAERDQLLAAFHAGRAAAIQTEWQADLAKLGMQVAAANTDQPANQTSSTQASYAAPSAAKTGTVAPSKCITKGPIVVAVTPQTLEAATTEQVWNRIAALHIHDSALDAGSIALLASQHPTAAAAAPVAISKFIVENPLLRMVNAFQRSIALDTVRNEYLLHRQIHKWLAAAPAANLDRFNERVYAELFLTPSSDPWLGLMPADTYTALENNGVSKSK
jgi:hypothetical protein